MGPECVCVFECACHHYLACRLSFPQRSKALAPTGSSGPFPSLLPLYGLWRDRRTPCEDVEACPPLPRGIVPERCPCQWIGYKKFDVGVNITFKPKNVASCRAMKFPRSEEVWLGTGAPLCSPNFTPRKHFMFSLFHWRCN